MPSVPGNPACVGCWHADMNERGDAVPRPPLPPRASALLARPNPAVITVVRPDGQPVSVATWYLWEEGRVLVNMDEGRRRLDWMRSDPRVSLTVLDGEQWYTHVSLQGRVTEIRDDPDLATIDRIARHYGAGSFGGSRIRGRVSAWIEVDRWHVWGEIENE